MRPSARVPALVLNGGALVGGLTSGIGGWPGGGTPSIPVGFPDCEAVGSGVIAQPAAAWTSLIFVAVGIWIAGDRKLVSVPGRLLFGSTISAVGIGSFFGHAAMTDWARGLDSLAIKLMIVTFIIASVGRLRSWNEPALIAGWASLAALTVSLEIARPGPGDTLLVVLVLAAITLVGLSTAPEARPWLVSGLTLLAAGALAWWLGRADGPLCAPRSWFQLHGLWHILAAAGIAAVCQIYRSEQT